MKQCPQCKKTFGGAELFCEECGVKLIDAAEHTMQTPADFGNTVAVSGDSDKTAYGFNQPGDSNATVYADRPAQGYNAPAGYNQDSGRAQNPVNQNPVDPNPVNQNPGNPGVRNYNNPSNYGPRNYGGQPQNRGGQRPAPRQKKPRKPIKISKKIWIALAELVLLIALVLVFNAVGNSKTDPVDSALKYFNAMVDGDYETIASLTNLPEGAFLTEEAFEKCCEAWSPISEGTITKVSAKEYDAASYYGDYYSDYYDYYGSSSGSSTGGMSDYTKTVVVEYMLSGDPEVYTYYLQLVSGEEKVMFFFNKWEVVQCTPFLAEDFIIGAPSGAKVVLDGYVLDETFLQTNEDESYRGDNYMVDLFVGNHTITVLVDGFKEATVEYNVEYNNDSYYFTYDNAFELSEETQNAVTAQGKVLLEQLYTAALAKDSAENALAGFAGNAAESMIETYDYLVEDVHYDEARTINKITLEELSAYSCYPTVSDGVAYVYLDLEGKVTFDYSYRDGAVKKTDSYYDYIDFCMYYQYIDGVWTPVEYGYFYY